VDELDRKETLKYRKKHKFLYWDSYDRKIVCPEEIIGIWKLFVYKGILLRQTYFKYIIIFYRNYTSYYNRTV
jgi:hypothetical protein